MKSRTPFIVGGAAVGVVILVLLVWWFSAEGWWPAILDIVLIFAALVSIALLAALIYAVLNFTRTIVQVKNEVLPVLQSLRTTSSAVREGAKTATAFGVDPAVRTVGVLAGSAQVASVLFGKGEARKRADKRQKRRQEIERELAERGELDGTR
jgi:hypothetical protein